MNLQFAVLAHGVAVDRFSNRLSIFNIIERIEAPNFPLLLPEVAFIAALVRNAGEQDRFNADITARIGNVNLAHARLLVDFQGSLSTRVIVNFQGLPIQEPGDLNVSFQLPAGQDAGITVPVTRSAAAQPGAQAVAERRQ